MKHHIIFGILFFILLSSVYSIQTPQINTGSLNELTIEYPKFDTFKLYENTRLYFHIYNGSSFALDNSTTTCIIYVYNKTDHILLENNLGFANSYDFEIILNTSVIKRVGHYSYLIYCNTSTQAGFASLPFEVTLSGFNETANTRILPSVIALIAILCFYSVIGYWGILRKYIGVQMVGFGMALIQASNIILLIYNDSLHIVSSNILKIIFNTNFLVLIAIALISLIIFLLRMVNPSDNLDAEDSPKWHSK